MRDHGLTDGRWVSRAGVLTWQPEAPALDPAREASLRAAHARFNGGIRDSATRRGEREYQAWRKRVQRARGKAA